MAQQLDEAIFGDRPKNLCRVEGCTRKRHQQKTMCAGHVQRQRRGLPIAGALRTWRRQGEARELCKVLGCIHPVLIHRHQLCSGHYRRKLKGQSIDSPLAERRKSRMVNTFVRLGPEAAAVLAERARVSRVARSALARRVLEDWAKAALRGAE